MDITITPAEVAKAVVGAAVGGAMVLGALAQHLKKVQRTLIGTAPRDPGAKPMADQLTEVARNTAHTAGAVDQLSERLEALEGRLDEAARDHAEELGRVKGRLEGIEGQVATVQRTVHTIAGRVDGLERDRGWQRRSHGRDIPVSGTEG
jgi:chromosome segregation ATPase